MSRTNLASLLVAIAGLAVTTAHAEPLGTAFTYQGELQDSGAPSTGVFDLEFAAFTQPDGGLALGTVCANDVAIADGRFAVLLDFGPLPTSRIYLGLRVRTGAGRVCGDLTGFTALFPRQEITPTPFATYATRSGSADTLNGQPASFYTDASNLTSGTIPTGRLSPTVARTDAAQTFTGAATFNNVANVFAGNGAGLLALNASNATSGMLADARLSPNIPRLNAANTWSGASNTFSGEVYTPTAVVSDRLLVRGPEAGAFFSQNATSTNYWKVSTQSTAGAAADDLQFLRYFNSNFGGISMTIKNDSGRVGVGTSFPTTKLAIQGSDASGLAYDAAISLKNAAPSGGYWSMNALANPNPGLVEPGSMGMYNNNGLFALMTQTGKMGLNGVFDPQATLDVNGQIYSRTGGIKFPDGSVQVSAASGSSVAVAGAIDFASVGSVNWTVPSGVQSVRIEMWGGGGGGCNDFDGGVGGAGGYARFGFTVTPGEVLTIQVGAGGLSAVPGTAGGATRVLRGATELAHTNGGGGGLLVGSANGTGGNSTITVGSGIARNGDGGGDNTLGGSYFAAPFGARSDTGYRGAGGLEDAATFGNGDPGYVIIEW